ncbi:MAG: T9SS type A sorting domain-containing protein [Flavobacteriales bacterium]|nr:T9SS type A sorting domain-containing protein [Flavobacteriales bacterium]
MRTLFTILSLAISSMVIGQNIHRCGTVEAIAHREAVNPGYSKAVEQTFEQVKHIIAQKDINDPDPIYQIPVVVHIVYNTPDENISSDLVYSQIARLNRDYRRLNEDTADTRIDFKPVAADAGIEFYLAGVDPQGNPSGGITRTQTSRADFAPDFFGNGLDDVKQSTLGGVDAWDTDNYLNIWVCDLLGNNSLFQILGFAYPPATAPNWPNGSAASDPNFEGVVIHYGVFGENNPAATGMLAVADKGRTAVHEVGHYLGLRHIWGDVLFGDGCTEDDGLDDTPNASANAGQVCNFNNNTCTDSPVDFPDMIENYMDYAEEQCMNLFTQDQVDIMRSMLETARTDLADGSVEPSGIDDLIDTNQIGLFPNPNAGLFQIQVPADLNLQAISVFDSKGMLVHQQSLVGSRDQVELALQVKPGAYFAQLQFDKGVANKRLLIN